MLVSLRKQTKLVFNIKNLQNCKQPIASLTSFPLRQFTIKKKSSKIWMNEHVNDAYVKKAKIVYNSTIFS